MWKNYFTPCYFIGHSTFWSWNTLSRALSQLLKKKLLRHMMWLPSNSAAQMLSLTLNSVGTMWKRLQTLIYQLEQLQNGPNCLSKPSRTSPLLINLRMDSSWTIFHPISLETICYSKLLVAQLPAWHSAVWLRMLPSLFIGKTCACSLQKSNSRTKWIAAWSRTLWLVFAAKICACSLQIVNNSGIKLTTSNEGPGAFSNRVMLVFSYHYYSGERKDPSYFA